MPVGRGWVDFQLVFARWIWDLINIEIWIKMHISKLNQSQMSLPTFKYHCCYVFECIFTDTAQHKRFKSTHFIRGQTARSDPYWEAERDLSLWFLEKCIILNVQMNKWWKKMLVGHGWADFKLFSARWSWSIYTYESKCTFQISIKVKCNQNS